MLNANGGPWFTQKTKFGAIKEQVAGKIIVDHVSEGAPVLLGNQLCDRICHLQATFQSSIYEKFYKQLIKRHTLDNINIQHNVLLTDFCLLFLNASQQEDKFKLR